MRKVGRMSKNTWILMVCCIVILFGGCRSKEIFIEKSEETDSTYESAENLLDETEASKIYVYVCGHVKCPGVYCMDAGERVVHAVEQAGGMSADADASKINMAETMFDGQKIYVPSVEEELRESSMESSENGSSDGKVNINCASLDVLMTLPGIGEMKARAILEYRENQGRFSELEELMEVPGIKEGVYVKIKDHIRID